MSQVRDIAHQFISADHRLTITPLGNGLINDTYRVSYARYDFVLQKINPQVFPEPVKIIDNLVLLNRHINNKQAKLLIPQLLPTLNQQTHVLDADGCLWRAISYIPRSTSIDRLETDNQAYEVGFALGHFHLLCCDLDPSKMQDTLPGFHIAPQYLSQYEHWAKRENTLNKSSEYRFCESYITKNKALTETLEQAKQQGLLTLNIIHGDPKLNNFLFDRQSHTIISLIDLDTVKPGLVHYDIGDCLRSCCRQHSPMRFDIDIAEIILTGYFAEAGRFFSRQDYNYLYAAIELIPFELGLRFFTDYLSGNHYFKVSEPEQNLYRAMDQFLLSKSIRQQADKFKLLIKKFIDR